MEGTPDISKVVGIIMENPELIERIGAMMREGEGETVKEEDASEARELKPAVEEASPNSVPAGAEARRHNRTRLLGAMKPYLNEHRVKAIDTMIGIVDALDMMRGK